MKEAIQEEGLTCGRKNKTSVNLILSDRKYFKELIIFAIHLAELFNIGLKGLEPKKFRNSTQKNIYNYKKFLVKTSVCTKPQKVV